MNNFIQNLREKAIFFKLSSKPKYGGAVSIEDVIKVLKSLADSYNSYIEIEYDKINTQGDKTKLKKIRSRLLDENQLVVVDLKFESCGMAVSPNTATAYHSIPNIKDIKEWKKEEFETYKDFVLDTDFNSQAYLKKVEKKYTPTQRQRIYKPLIDGIINNEKFETKFGFGIEPKHKTFNKPKDQTYQILAPVSNLNLEEEKLNSKTSMALVEIRGGKTKPKILDLFEEIKTPVFPFDTITFEDKTYKLKYTIYCELIHENDSYSLENKQLGIYAFGKTFEESQLNFSEEFDYIYNRYNSLQDEQLSQDVISIKQFLNLIVD